MTIRIRVKNADNGYIISYDDFDNEDNKVICEKVFEDKTDSVNGARETFINVLYQMIDYFNLEYQKHHRPEDKFIKISLVDGEHYFSDLTTGHDNVKLGDAYEYPVLSAEEAEKQRLQQLAPPPPPKIRSISKKI